MGLRAIACTFVLLAAIASAGARAAPSAACPGGTLRMGLVPSEDTQTLVEVYGPLASELGQKLGCRVDLSISTSYSAGIEAMRSKHLDLETFGPLSYVLAHRVADAQAIVQYGYRGGSKATYEATIVTPKSSGITTLREVAGRSFAYSDAASTSGYLMPAYALQKAGIDPKSGIHPFFAGSHAASFEALRNHKVDAGELNTAAIRVATATGEYNAADFRTLWRSAPIPSSPMAVRGDLAAALRTRLQTALLSLDLAKLPDPKHLLNGRQFVAANDAEYDPIRAIVATLHIDLQHLGE